MYFVVFEEIPSVKRMLVDHGYNHNERPFSIGTSNKKVLTFSTLEALNAFLETVVVPDDYDLNKHLNDLNQD